MPDEPKAEEPPEWSKDALPVDPSDWPLFRKKTVTRAIRILGTFRVQTIHSGVVECTDGYLAVDDQGFPYPIDAQVFEASYEPVGPVEVISEEDERAAQRAAFLATRS